MESAMLVLGLAILPGIVPGSIVPGLNGPGLEAAAAVAVLPTEEWIVVQSLTPVSAEFRNQTLTAIRSIPVHVQRVVGRAGWRIQLAGFVVDAQPTLAQDRPRGWPAETSWFNSDAIHFPDQRLLVVAEKRRTRAGHVVPAARVAGVLRHELGHAYDLATGRNGEFRSSSTEFRAAYHTDIIRIPGDPGKELAYYLQDSNAGRQEAYAEAFGVLLGGGSDVTKDELFRQHFPAVLEFVQQELEGGSE